MKTWDVAQFAQRVRTWIPLRRPNVRVPIVLATVASIAFSVLIVSVWTASQASTNTTGSKPSNRAGDKSTASGISSSAMSSAPVGSSSPTAVGSNAASNSQRSRQPAESLDPNDAAYNYVQQLPKFGPAPQAERIPLSAGPLAPWVTRVPTTQPVAFITVDDGWEKSPVFPKLFRAAGVPVTLFLSLNAIKNNPDYFKELQAAGAVIETHTLYHNMLRGKPYEAQLGDICGSMNQLHDIYGRRPILFRPPYGEKDDNTLKAAYECGARGVFYWTSSVDGGVVTYASGNSLQPGDILLLHFRPEFAGDFVAALKAIKAAGLTPALLSDYYV